MSSLIIEEDGPVLRATMNRPERLNALDSLLVEELRELLGRAFCSGLDLKLDRKAAIERGVTDVLVGQRRISEIVIAMRRCPQPIVALVDGPASGGGFALALASDIRIATPRTKMNAAFIRIGLSACDIGVSYFLPRMVGSAIAAEYLLTGRFMDAETALALRLVSRLVGPEQIAAAGDEIVADMLRATPLGLRLTKDALNHAIDAGSLEAVVAMEDRNQALCSQDPDFAEGLASFLEKRSPVYRGL